MQVVQPEPLKFVVGGKALTVAEIAAITPKVKRPPTDTSQKFHKGFRVEGHPPGAIEAAEKSARQAVIDWDRAAVHGNADGKRPKEWSEAFWRHNQKKRPVRAKPYEVPEAAKVCADMATKAGWLDVVVAEIKRGDPA